MGPPAGVLPGVVALELVLARNGQAVVSVGHLEVYPVGLAIPVRLLTVSDDVADMSARGVPRGRRDMRTRGEAKEDGVGGEFHFGLEYSDGRKAVGDRGWAPREERQPDQPVLLDAGGVSGPLRSDRRFWVWPLPPAGPLSFLCEWSVAGLALSRAAIDAQLVLDAAARALTIFEGVGPR